ncbi:ParA family protein [Bacillus paralicheniformis]|uniref:ParA family protein n=1 Tax=Bacillus paralicheniformis TaxID=1648923 RepID=UPI000C772A35|nr:ParA family protein [Bacillus paralicheniformis]MBR8664360.1 ParA family protein [Bacillus paralicheniformis]MCB6216339.1 ParA family protein [Bacillus paralicheniformis]MCJ8222523.1 ParA family protein [Bacillus paralicheniformis]PLC17684.1 chromosome partitioning protein [Bacillus paralicheniformis]TWJ42458.1 Chromosome partitioning protein ParA [Bacillus paralicheniformis]
MKILSFFNNKGGVGKTTSLYHVGFKLEQMGYKVLFVDCDPQCNLTSHILEFDVIENAWSEEGKSIYDALKPIIKGAGDVKYIEPLKIEKRKIWIYPGDLLLSNYDSALSESWTQVLARQERGFRSTTAIYRLFTKFAEDKEIDYVLVDLGPNLGSLNRAMLLSCDNFFIPLIPDLFSLRGSQNLGATLVNWIEEWQDSIERIKVDFEFKLPQGNPEFSGYITSQFNEFRKRPVKAWQRWESEIPQYIRDYVYSPLAKKDLPLDIEKVEEELKIGQVKNYNSLIPLAQTALKPIFELTSKDGIIGDHHRYVKECSASYDELVNKIISKV